MRHEGILACVGHKAGKRGEGKEYEIRDAIRVQEEKGLRHNKEKKYKIKEC